MAGKAVSKGGSSNALTYGIIAIAILAVGGGGFMAVKAFGGTPNPNSNTPSNGGNTNSGGNSIASRPSSGGGSSSNSNSSSNSGFPLQTGSSGDNVRTLQSALDGLGANLVIDGSFGAETVAALKKYTGSSTVANQAALDAIVNSQPTYKAAAAATAQQNVNPVCMCSILCNSPSQQACKTITNCNTTTASCTGGGGIWCDIKKIF